MRQSCHLGATMKQEPKEAQSAAQSLLLRAGFLKPVAPRSFALMPGLTRVKEAIARRARKELTGQGYEDCCLPLLEHLAGDEPAGAAPSGRRLCLETRLVGLFAGLIRSEVFSAKHLPKRIQTVQPLLYDRSRSRSGLISWRESTALLALGCDAGPAEAEGAVRAFREAAEAVCAECGLTAGWVPSLDPDAAAAEEAILVLWNGQGEETVLHCQACGYVATRERAESRLESVLQDEEPRELQAVYGPGLIGVKPLAEFLELPLWKTSKTLLMQADERMVAVMVRGDCEVNEAKVRRHLGCRELRLASAQAVKDLTGAEIGYAGPVDLPPEVTVLADEASRERVNFECGANRTDYHLINVNFGRDLDWPEFGDFKQAAAGHLCPCCDRGSLQEQQAVRLGWSRLLERSFSEACKCSYQGQDGRPQPMIFTSGGLDLGVVAAAVAEVHRDEAGLVWPRSVCPWQVHLLGLNLEKEEVRSRAEALCQELQAAGLSVLFDDRSLRAGEKFRDADLMGIPVRLTMSKRTFAGGQVELKQRDGDSSELLPVERAVQEVRLRLGLGEET